MLLNLKRSSLPSVIQNLDGEKSVNKWYVTYQCQISESKVIYACEIFLLKEESNVEFW